VLPQQQQQQQQQRQRQQRWRRDSRQGECGGQQGKDILEPLLFDAEAPTCLGSERSTAQQLPAIPAAAAAAASEGGAGTSRLQLLQQLLLPIMLQGFVEPGMIGVLFAGEAVGSVVAPFVVDWMLSRRDSSSNSGSSGAGSSSSRGAASVKPCSSSSSSSSRQYASWLLLLSAVGMAVCCAFVLTLWQLPAALKQTPAVQSLGNAAVQPLTSAAVQPMASAAALKHISAGQPSTNTPGQLLIATQTSTGVVGQQVLSGFAAVGRAEWALQPSSKLGGLFNCTDVDSDPLSCAADGIVALKILQHSPWGGSLATHTPAVPMFGTGNGTSTGSGVGLSHSLGRFDSASAVLMRNGAAADGSAIFGVVELCVIGFVLLLLGSCHSSCETLIYTVLTDAVTAKQSESGNESERGSESVAAAAGSSPDDTDVDVDVGAGDVDSVGASGHAPSGCVSSSSSSNRGSSKVGGESAAGAAASAGVNAADAAPSGCISSTSSSECDMDVECDIEVQVDEDASHGTGSSSCANQDSESDCTEVVMVLYVLFWVVGFSEGAGVVGLMPGSELAQLQAVVCVLGLLLGVVGRWTWLTVAV
jgi:hypothetical protein